MWVNQRPGIRNNAGVIAIIKACGVSLAHQGESYDFGEGHSEEASEVPLFKKIAIYSLSLTGYNIIPVDFARFSKKVADRIYTQPDIYPRSSVLSETTW